MLVKTSEAAPIAKKGDEEWSGAGGWLTTSEAAERLGYKSSRRIRQLCAEGKIPYRQMEGGKYLIPLEWVDAEARKIAPVRRKPARA